jgi:mRNA interferase RelE/StbE
MAYQVRLKPRALREMVKLPPEDRERVVGKIRSLRQDARPPGCEKVQGTDYLRVRAGDYRIVYEVSGHLVMVLHLGHRRDVYRYLP